MYRGYYKNEIGFAIVGAGLFCCLKAFYSWPDSDTPEPYKEWTKPATPTKRIVAATLGFVLIVGGAWLIRNTDL